MNNEDINSENNRNKIIDLVKKMNLEMHVDFSTYENGKKIKLPYIVPKKLQPRQNSKNVRNKLVKIGDFCQSIYTHTNATMNQTKTVEDIINDSKLKAIEDIKNDFFINQTQTNKGDNSINNNNAIYKKIVLNKSYPKRLRKNDISINNNNNDKEEKFTYLTTTYERNQNNKSKNAHHSIDNNKRGINKYDFGDYASNKFIINHPKLYILNNKRENNKLPKISGGYRKINNVKELSKLIPDSMVLNREEKLNRYDEFMKMKELKELKTFNN